MVKCRDCGHEHPSIIQMDTSDFKTAMIQEERGVLNAAAYRHTRSLIISSYNNRVIYSAWTIDLLSEQSIPIFLGLPKKDILPFDVTVESVVA